MSQRRHAVRLWLGQLGEAEPLLRLEPLLLEAFGTSATTVSTNGPESLRATNVRILMDAIAALPPEERVVPGWVLRGLIVSQGPPWSIGPQGEELRATILVQLLHCAANCVTLSGLPEARAYLEQPGFKLKEDTVFPLKAYLLSGETPDLLRKGARLVNRHCPAALNPSARRARDTPSLQVKRDVRNYWTTALLTTGWAMLRSWSFMLNMQAVLTIGTSVAGALAGIAVLETLWQVEEQVIESHWYFEEPAASLSASAAMVALNCLGGAFSLRFYCGVPFAINRLMKDDFLDAHRRFET